MKSHLHQNVQLIAYFYLNYKFIETEWAILLKFIDPKYHAANTNII